MAVRNVLGPPCLLGLASRGLEQKSAMRCQVPHPQPRRLDHLVRLDSSVSPPHPSKLGSLCPRVSGKKSVMLDLTVSFSTYHSVTCWV